MTSQFNPPVTWDKRTYLEYCDGIMMIPGNTIQTLYKEETGFYIFSLSQIPGNVVRTKYLSYLKPNQLMDILIIDSGKYYGK